MPEIVKSWSDFKNAALDSDKFKIWSVETSEDKVRYVISTSQFAIMGEVPKKEFTEMINWCKRGVVVQLAEEPYIDTSKLYSLKA